MNDFLSQLNADRPLLADGAMGTMLNQRGITFLIVAQAFFNIGIVTKIFPNKGLPLPFVSRGGTNIVVMLTLIGTLISVARHTPKAVLQVKATLRSNGANPFAEFPA